MFFFGDDEEKNRKHKSKSIANLTREKGLELGFECENVFAILLHDVVKSKRNKNNEIIKALDVFANAFLRRHSHGTHTEE